MPMILKNNVAVGGLLFLIVFFSTNYLTYYYTKKSYKNVGENNGKIIAKDEIINFFRKYEIENCQNVNYKGLFIQNKSEQIMYSINKEKLFAFCQYQ